MTIQKREKFNSIAVDVVSGFLILLFVYAAVSKLLDYQKFRVELGKSPILNVFAGTIAVCIPLIEILLSIMLTTKKFQYIALYLSFSLMAVFSAYIIAILKFSPYIPCSCGGILQNMSWTEHLIFNLVFISACIIAILLYPTQEQRAYSR